jgi:uncharacterized protein (TIGR03086 family)
MDVNSQLAQLGPVLADVVANITSDQLDNPTPCDAFNVRGVLEHMIGGANTFAAVFRGQPPAPADLPDPLTAFGPALSSLVDAITAPDALEQTVQAPFGEVPADTFARFIVLDGLVHGWDLATATGQPYTPPAPLVSAVMEFAQGAVPSLRDGKTFANATAPPPAATPIERLAAFTGRKV